MTAPTRPLRGAFHRPRGSTLPWAAAGIVVGAGAGAAAVASTAEAHRAAVAATVGGALILWSVLVGLAAVQAARAAWTREELDTQRERATRADARIEELRADLTATHTAAAHLRAALATAQAEADGARTDLDTARDALAAAEAETAELRVVAEEAREQREQLDRLSTDILPEVVAGLRRGSSVDTVTTSYRDLAHAMLLRNVAEEIGKGERQRAAALAVCATAAGRVQALATSMHAELREMQHRHGEDVLGDLLSLDHATAQAGRMADSIAVLTGARSGRRWAKPIGVESILRGALGRIGAYQRVRLHSASTAAVAGYAAEGVMHALAELLDNAANFSAPPAEVHVYVEEANAGLVITVEDGGLGLSDSWLRRAERAVSPEPLDLTALSAGTRIGLAVVGALARKHGLSISFRPSARGGTGVVVLIPSQLITHPEPAMAPTTEPAAEPTSEPATAGGRSAAPAGARAQARTQARTQPRTIEAVRPAPASVPETETESEPEPTSEPSGANGLPQRRRGQTLASARPTPGAGTTTVTAQPVAAQPVRADAAVAAARFGAFRRALQAGANTSGSNTGGADTAGSDTAGSETNDALPKDES
ncbi:sensor histidine kinase [Kitasatospora sp. McL0602]|uniref:sensor histidine kinase n=1 Tax=Kitasatospora sp. McL0602 TaxID=3439530 RepID=UPI003F8A6CD2